MAGGRVTKLTAAPLMQVLFPEFQAIAQPLNGNIAIRRSAIETVAMGLKYQADLQILIATGLKYGPETIAQVHCGSFKQDGQDLNSLERMANQYVRVIFESAQKSGRLVLPGGIPDHFIQHMIEPAGVIKTTKHPVDEILLPPALATGDYREKFKTHITAIRHAPTVENESGIIQGRQDTDIKETALPQYFNQIGLDRLEKPDVAVISGLKRTRQTSDVICGLKGWNDIPVVVDRRLDERNWGEFQGMSRGQLRSRYSNIDEIMEGQDTKFRPSGGETAEEVEARANESFADLRRIYPGRKVMVVGHAAALSSLGLRPDTASHVWVDRTPDGEYKLHRPEF